MTSPHAGRSGGQILVDALRGHGARIAYGVPGESYLAVLEALYQARESIDFVVCRHEASAAHMAEAHGKLSGEPGLCFVTRGPGATHASIAVHTARQDSTPLILFIGQVARDTAGREAWQEIDYRQMYGGIAKWVEQIDDARRIPELVSRAFHVATAGRPGPVVLALPEDMLTDVVEVADAPRWRRSEAAPAPQAMAELQQRLAAAERPLLLLGGGGWSAEACADLARFAAAHELPVACGFRRQDLLDQADPHYVGEAGLGMDPRLAQRLRDADLLLAVGARLGETSTQGYALVGLPTPAQALVHVHADPEELGRVYAPTLPIQAGMAAFARAAAALPPTPSPRWAGWTAAARADFLAFTAPPSPPMPGELDLVQVMAHLRAALPPDTVVSNGAGNYTLWVQRFWRYRGFRTQLAPTSGTMGYGLPAAIAALRLQPGRSAVCFAGDGCFLMSGHELATAVQYALPVLVIVVDNGMYGSIRMHQERHYPGNVWGTTLRNPDFAALARSHGAHGETVERSADFPAALARARAAGGPALIHLRVSPEALTPKLTVQALRGGPGPRVNP